MNKEEFLQKVNDLRYSGYSSHEYESRDGFNKCREAVIKLIPELDIEGLNPKAFELYRKTLNDMTELYTQLFEQQSQIFYLQKERNDLYKSLSDKDIEIMKLNDFLYKHNLIDKYHKEAEVDNAQN